MILDPEIRLRVKGDVEAPMSVVYQTVADHAAYSDWSAWEESELERPGDPDQNGFGAIRVLRDRSSSNGSRAEVRELVNAYWPPYLLGYRLQDNPLIREHQGIVIVRAVNDSVSRVIWHLTASAVNPDYSERLAESLDVRLHKMVADLCAEAGRRHLAGAPSSNKV